MRRGKCNICNTCKKAFDGDRLVSFDDRLWCPACLAEYTTICEDCGERIYTDDATYTADEYPVCDACCDANYFCCEACERVYHNEHMVNGVCEWCYEDGECATAEPDNERYYFKSRRDLPVGVEIEAEGGDYMGVYDELSPKGFGVGKDGSLDDGIEVQVPASNEGNTEKLIEQACESLRRNGFRISKRCGLHIHIEFPSRKKTIKRLLLMAYACEPILYAINPKSRRANGFCKPLASAFKASEIISADTGQIDKLFYSKGNSRITKCAIKYYKASKWNDCRYFGLNLHSLFYQGTIEFRYHAGTMEPGKIISWASLLKSILLYVRYDYEVAEVLRLIEQPTILAKLRYLCGMLRLSEPLPSYFISRYIKFSDLCAG